METGEKEEFAGRSVVITGAGGGIGSVLVQRFLTRGARVFAVDRDQDALDRLQAEQGKSAKLSTAVLDVSDESQCRDFAARVRSEWKVVDVLINAAGYFPLTPFEELTYARWREIIAINLDGPFLVTHNLLPLLKESQAGRIIFFSSASIYAGCPSSVPMSPPRRG